MSGRRFVRALLSMPAFAIKACTACRPWLYERRPSSSLRLRARLGQRAHPAGLAFSTMPYPFGITRAGASLYMSRSPERGSERNITAFLSSAVTARGRTALDDGDAEAVYRAPGGRRSGFDLTLRLWRRCVVSGSKVCSATRIVARGVSAAPCCGCSRRSRDREGEGRSRADALARLRAEDARCTASSQADTSYERRAAGLRLVQVAVASAGRNKSGICVLLRPGPATPLAARPVAPKPWPRPYGHSFAGCRR